MSNVVALKRPEEAAAEPISEKDIYLRIFANSKDSVFLVEPGTYTIIFANPHAVEDTSYEATELVGLKIQDLFLPDEQAAITTLLDTTMQWNTGTDPQRTLKRKTGRKLIVEISSSSVEFDGRKVLFCSVRDITARIKAEDKVRKHAEELESKVAERTQELAKVNESLVGINSLITAQKKEIDDVMTNIQQAIFTISPALMINSQHSKHVSEVFGTKSAAGQEIVGFLYEEADLAGKGKGLHDSLELVFMQPDTWEMMKDLLPREHRYLRPSADGKKEFRELKLDWCPISDGTTFVKIMVICLDVTEQKRLHAEIAKQEAAHQEQLELIAQLISLPQETVGQFVADTKRFSVEAKEALIRLTTAPADRESFDALMRTMHTLKGAGRQFRLNTIQGRAHELESRVTAWLKAPAPEVTASQDFVKSLHEEFGPLEKGLADVHMIYDKTVGGGQRTKASADCAPVPLARLERVIESLGPDHEQIRRGVAWLAQSSVGVLFGRLEQMALSLGDELGKPVEILRAGDEVELDFRTLDLLYDAFLHAIRNSMDHGAESTNERIALGKSEKNRIRIEAHPDADGTITLILSDDGRGIDAEHVRTLAVERGLVTSEVAKSATKEEIVQYVFAPGFSTKTETTTLSGRGVGMDVVKNVVEKALNGKAWIESVPGQGTRLFAKFPADAIPVRPKATGFMFSTEVGAKEILAEVDGKLGLRLAPWDEERMKRRAAIFDHASLPSTLPPLSIGLDVTAPAAVSSDLFLGRGLKQFISRQQPHWQHSLRATVSKLVGHDSGTFEWGPSAYLEPGTRVISRRIRDYGLKNSLIEELMGQATTLIGRTGFVGITDILATVADEMIMNALFDAPRDEHGKEKYNQLDRKHRLVVEERETATLRLAVDARFVALSIEDPFGALSHQTLSKYLAKCYARGPNQIDQKKGGAGLGLFTIFESAHHFVVNVQPGRRTEMICLIGLSRSFEKYQRAGKSLSYFDGGENG